MRTGERDVNGRFVAGHKKIGGMAAGDTHTDRAKALVSESLRGSVGSEARRWKGQSASYAAKHMWIKAHYGKADHCEIDPSHVAKRFEWSNISGTYKCEREDYRPLCPSCHRKVDHGDECRNGHPYEGNTYLSKQGWRGCIICRRKAAEKYRAKNN